MRRLKSERGQALLRGISHGELIPIVRDLLDAHRRHDEAGLVSGRRQLRLVGLGDEQVDDLLGGRQVFLHVMIHSPYKGHVIRKYQVEGEYVEEGSRLYDVAEPGRFVVKLVFTPVRRQAR